MPVHLRALLVLIHALAALPFQGYQAPAPQGYVNDFAHVIPAATASTIAGIIDDVRAKSGGEIVVVTLPDVGQRDAADVAREIGRQWKVGKAGNPGDPARNTGVIILVVPKETSSSGRGQLRIETGYGAEGFITDATAGAIQDEALPLFRAGDYGGGIELITLRVAQRFAGEFHFQVDTSFHAPSAPQATRRPRGSPGGIPPFVLLLILFVILSMLGGG